MRRLAVGQDDDGPGMTTDLTCYLLREAGEWYELGHVRHWGLSFVAFPGPPDGSTILAPEDVHLLGLRIDGHGHDLPTRMRIAADIVRWSIGKSVRFVTDLSPEVEPGVAPSPMTGSIRRVLPQGDPR